jgi:penicillin-binding protein 1A
MTGRYRYGWRRRRPLFWKLRLAIKTAFLLAVASALSLGVAFVYYTMAFPDPIALRHKERAPIIRILARDGTVLAERGTAYDYVPLDLIPRHVVDAVVATEDRRFFAHRGIDAAGLARAAFANLRAGHFAQGGSTLTQQLAKNLFLSPKRTFERKLEELVLALWLELRLSKQDILELYLNRVYFGAGAYGVEAAAQRYFDKSARELSLGEAAVVAGLLKAPSKFSPSASPGAARARGRSVLAKMHAAGALDPVRFQTASREIVRFAEPNPGREQTGVEYAVDFVLERLPPLLGTGHAEVVVETTIDATLQRRAQAAVQQAIDRADAELQVGQAAAVVLDMEGGILALVGGRSYAESQFNRAVKARRQPGSAFKPVVYLAALESGLSPDSIAYDLPVHVGAWQPRNDNGQYKGAVTLRQGLAQSINTVAVRLQQDIGAAKVVAAAERLGIGSELHAGPSLALGTSEVTLLELTGAYGTFAGGGVRLTPHAIRRVRTSSGRVLFTREATRAKQIVAPAHVGAMNDMLNAALVAGTGRRAAIPQHPAAGKTGTTQDFRDAWFVGYTAHRIAGVWAGNDAGRAMNQVKGGMLPALIWREIMGPAHQGLAALALPGTARTSAPDARDPSARVRPAAEPVPAGPPKPGQAPPAPATASGTPAARAPSPPLLPRERIDAGFVARQLAEPPATRVASPPSTPEDRSAAQRGEPSGMMGLGAQAKDN